MIDNKLLLEITEYCTINDILDIDFTVNKMLRDGFNIAKYGMSPFDNSKKETNNEHIKIENVHKDEEQNILTTDNPIVEVTKSKKTIRIIKNK